MVEVSLTRHARTPSKAIRQPDRSDFGTEQTHDLGRLPSRKMLAQRRQLHETANLGDPQHSQLQSDGSHTLELALRFQVVQLELKTTGLVFDRRPPPLSEQDRLGWVHCKELLMPSSAIDWPEKLNHLVRDIEVIPGQAGKYCCRLDVDVDPETTFLLNEFRRCMPVKGRSGSGSRTAPVVSEAR